MSFKFIYSKEYLRPLRATLVDIRYTQEYPVVTSDDLFYTIEYSGGSLAGVLILTVNNAKQSCIEKFYSIRTPFVGFKSDIKNRIKDFITSGDWKKNYLFYSQKITGVHGGGGNRVPRKTLYGFHGLMNFSARPYSDPDVLDAIDGLGDFDDMRYPGGDISNTFNWQTGRDELVSSGIPNTLQDVQALYNRKKCDIVFCINMCTRGLPDQLNMLATAAGLGIPIKFIEMGNEMNRLGSIGHTTFPTAMSYATTCATWGAAIRAVYPDVLIGVCGENKGWQPDWNDIMLANSGCDALITHIGVNVVDISTNGIVDLNRLNSALMQSWDNSGMGLVTSVPTWCTEYNYHYDPNNLLTQDSRIETALFMTQKISDLISVTNKDGIKVMCIRGIEGQSQGALLILDRSIILQATGIAMQQFLASVN